MIPQLNSITPRILTASLTAALTLLASAAHGTPITWGTPQQINGTGDVSTTGTLIGAFNVGGTGAPSTTVNGVTFQGFSTNSGNGSSGNFTTVGSGFVNQTNNGHGSPNAPFSTLPAAYQTLLQSAAVPFSGSITLTITGLIVGMQYQFQWWANDSSFGLGGTTATAGNSVELQHNVSGVEGGLGQWVIGSFTADSITQSIVFSGDGDFGSFNAFQLRQVSQPTGPVPDTGSTLALLGLTVASLAVARQKIGGTAATRS